MVVSMPEHEPLFLVKPRHSGYRQKALVWSKTILVLYRGGDVEIKGKEDKWKTNIVRCPGTRYPTIIHE